MPPRALAGATRVLAGQTKDETLQGVAGAAPDAKAFGGAGEDPLVVPVQPDGKAGLAGGSTANGGCLSADNAQTEGATDLTAAFCGLPISFGGERLAVCTAAASRGGGNLAAFDAERPVGLPALALATGAMGPAAGLEAILAAGMAVCGPVLSAAQAEAGLAPFIAEALLACTVGRAIVLAAGVAAAGAGFRDGGSAVAAEAEIVQQEAALAFRLAGTGAAALEAAGAVFRAVRGNLAAMAKALRGRRSVGGIAGMTAATCGLGGRMRVGKGKSRCAGHWQRLLS